MFHWKESRGVDHWGVSIRKLRRVEGGVMGLGWVIFCVSCSGWSSYGMWKGKRLAAVGGLDVGGSFII